MRRPDTEGDVIAVIVGTIAAGLLLKAVVLLTGCSDLGPAVDASNVQRALGHESAKWLQEHCTAPVQRAKTQAEIDAVNEAGCPEAARAHRAVRTSHGVVVATLLAIDAGRCTSLVSQAPRECNLTEAWTAAVKAAQAFERAKRAVEENGR